MLTHVESAGKKITPISRLTDFDKLLFAFFSSTVKGTHFHLHTLFCSRGTKKMLS
uniref:Uncharacterized protein n=1 Tax=Anguilla anguilla TaxID=7936 RepID=A0A0E9S6Z3_ANGAN